MAQCTWESPDWTDLPDIPDGLTADVITEGCVDGDGIYDVFMKAHRDAIQQEYTKQRIKGVEYSKVYLGGMQAAMQQSVVFALGKDEAVLKAELARYSLIKVQADVELIGQQICKIQKEIEFLDAQREMIAAQTWAEIAKTDANNIQSRMKELLGGNYNGPQAATPESVIGSAVDKTDAEIGLLVQKKLTEVAQIEDQTLIGGSYAPVQGVIGKEKNLLQRQADGFLRDAEAKVAKIATDAFAVQFSTMDGEVDTDLGSFSIGTLSTMLSNASTRTGDADHTDTPIDDT